ncbi:MULTISPECIES: hypothetical protein [Mycolicibacterium]|uniref:Exported alanine and valine rich protein n=1 Tax=Mycolicibacterium goodii TaxID=134601 RepID=A0ABS6I0M0_MYCGD|nr:MULTISPECIES: hypothetical protein [Mycolicibacterium]OKH65602.1 hypothetical protein EB74_06590 [Mycobacterium sp. SWH-M5]MBU8810154.1 hypothetical protein [Mycolicibacterium goodii]MBU8816399.1 hypothetical protein [Mycolicibacterium goodii]MBU8827499.1 hypothetical protein [Mycolicibacterium goodii]MBU8833855.1 hypothetical protein [Mycolicibacterium goodii]
MARWFALLISALTVLAGLAAPHAAAADGTPIGRIGETLRVDFDGIVADVTVHDVLASEVPPGWGWNGSPRWRAQGSPWRAPVTVSTISSPTPYAMALAFTFNGVTPYADAYQPKHTDAPNALEAALRNAPPGSTVNGDVYWDVYRALVTNVVLTDRKTGQHLAQWNLWQPGAPLP